MFAQETWLNSFSVQLWKGFNFLMKHIMTPLCYNSLYNRQGFSIIMYLFPYFLYIFYYYLRLLLSQPPNGAVPVRNYVIHLFYPCQSNQWAVEQPACIWLRVALGSTVMCLTIIQTGQALLTWEAMRFMLIWGLGWSGLPKGWSNKTSVAVPPCWRACVWEYIGCWWDLLLLSLLLPGLMWTLGFIVRDDNTCCGSCF